MEQKENSKKDESLKEQKVIKPIKNKRQFWEGKEFRVGLISLLISLAALLWGEGILKREYSEYERIINNSIEDLVKTTALIENTNVNNKQLEELLSNIQTALNTIESEVDSTALSNLRGDFFEYSKELWQIKKETKSKDNFDMNSILEKKEEIKNQLSKMKSNL